jgi:hypothetical protein
MCRRLLFECRQDECCDVCFLNVVKASVVSVVVDDATGRQASKFCLE